MGNPRVAAWKEAESIRPFGSAAPSQVLEMNKRKKLVHFVAAVVCLNGAQMCVSVCVFFFPSPSQVVFVRLLRPVYKASEGNLAWLVAPS